VASRIVCMCMCVGWSRLVKEVRQSGISGVSAVKGLQGCGYVCNR